MSISQWRFWVSWKISIFIANLIFFNRNVFLCDYKGKRSVIKRIPFQRSTNYVNSELQILRICNHPRIIKFIDFFHSINNYNFILEYASNGSLRNFIANYQKNNFKVAEDDLYLMLLDMAFGIKYLHKHKIIHRDLKPENVLVDENWRLKLGMLWKN